MVYCGAGILEYANILILEY